jgi:hypothetical protein
VESLGGRLVDYIERDRKETWYEGMDRIQLAHGKEAVMDFLVPEKADNTFISWATFNFWRRILSYIVFNESSTVPSMNQYTKVKLHFIFKNIHILKQHN